MTVCAYVRSLTESLLYRRAAHGDQRLDPGQFCFTIFTIGRPIVVEWLR